MATATFALSTALALLVTRPATPLETQVTSLETWDCKADDVAFELLTGYVYSAPEDILRSRPGTLQLQQCLRMCRSSRRCRSVNFETGLCVLLASSADYRPESLSISQFPVFTMYARKVCLGASLPAECGRPAWSHELVPGHTLLLPPQDDGFNATLAAVTLTTAADRIRCLLACITTAHFHCRSASFEAATGACRLSRLSRHALGGLGQLQVLPGVDHLEPNCLLVSSSDACVFGELPGRLLKTVDAVFRGVNSSAACRQLCTGGTGGFSCRSWDYSAAGPQVCRTSHHSAHTLTHLLEPYLAAAGAVTHQLLACYRPQLQCRSADMQLLVHTDRLFSGRIYSRSDSGQQRVCGTRVPTGSLQLQLAIPYRGSCQALQQTEGVYTADVVLQRHPQVRTSDDLSVRLRCTYTLDSRTVSSQASIRLLDDSLPVHRRSQLVASPLLQLLVVDQRDGQLVRTARVGQALALRVSITDGDSPFSLQLTQLRALDGAENGSSLQLLDAEGCTLESDIMASALLHDQHTVIVQFQAFRFPGSKLVQFQALVTPCLRECPPSSCHSRTSSPRTARSLPRLHQNPPQDSLLLVNALLMEDSFPERHGPYSVSSTKDLLQRKTGRIHRDNQTATTDRPTTAPATDYTTSKARSGDRTGWLVWNSNGLHSLSNTSPSAVFPSDYNVITQHTDDSLKSDYLTTHNGDTLKFEDNPDEVKETGESYSEGTEHCVASVTVALVIVLFFMAQGMLVICWIKTYRKIIIPRNIWR